MKNMQGKNTYKTVGKTQIELELSLKEYKYSL